MEGPGASMIIGKILQAQIVRSESPCPPARPAGSWKAHNGRPAKGKPDYCAMRRRSRQTISFIEISIEADILLGGKHKACFVLGVAGIEPMPS